MQLAKWTFYGAGIYGLAVIAPLYLLEQRIAQDNPPAITHPEFFYGFVGVALAWQLAFLAIGRQPQRLRPMMPFAVLEKLSYGVATLVLYAQGRLAASELAFGVIDLALGAAFLVAWRRIGDAPA